jgi:peptidyl-prolyl cis-trans isomerase C
VRHQAIPIVQHAYAAEIRVNGRVISEAEINRELQYHPADSLPTARRQAATALAVRALLLSEADRLGIAVAADAEPEAAAESRVAALLEQEVARPEPDQGACRRWFEHNSAQLRGPDRFRVSHIFRPAPPADVRRRVAARNLCRRLIQVLHADPARFGRLARRHSRCPSAAQDGLLGDVGPGQTCPEFERALGHLAVGTVSPYPLETRYGFHVVWLHEREQGAGLPFEQARPLIEEYLRESVWRRSVNQYLKILAARADVRGISLDAADSPLVQ